MATNYERKRVKKPILANLGAQILKKFSLVHTVVVPAGETNISKLLTTLTHCRVGHAGKTLHWNMVSSMLSQYVNIETTLHKKIICAMLAQSAQICFPRKTGFKYVW